MEFGEQRYCYNPKLKWNSKVEEYFVKAYGSEHFSRISEALTGPSCYSCIRVNTLKSTSDAVINKLLKILKERRPQDGKMPNDSKRSNDLVLEPFGHFDASDFLSDIQENLVSKCSIPGLQYVVLVKGSGPHDIDYGYTEGNIPKEVIVSRKCAEAVLRGAQVYVPGVLACSAHVEKGDSVAVSVALEQPGNDGGWSTNMTRGTVLQGDETDPYYFERNGLYIGQGTTMFSRSGIFRASEGLAVDMNNRVFQLPSFNDLLEGEIFLQNLPSIIAAHVLDPQQGERILDMCAAPGGKTTAIAILMKDKGQIVAADRSHNKVLDIKKLAAEMGLNCISSYKLDALKAVVSRESVDAPAAELPDDICHLQDSQTLIINGTEHSDAKLVFEGGTKNPKNGCYASKAKLRKDIRKMRNGVGRNQISGVRVEICKGFLPDSFDRVLLDGPCSALGLRPRLFVGEETVESLRSHARYQRKMFDQAVQLVRPGGILVYSTCTINPGENEGLVRYALDKYKFLSLAEQRPRVGGPGLLGGCQLSDGYTEEWLRPGEEELVQRFDPSSPLDTIGFFIAKFAVGPKDA